MAVTAGRNVRKCWISDLYVKMDRRVAVLINTGAKELVTAAGVAMPVEKVGD